MMEGILGDFQESEELSNFEFKKAFEDMEKLNPLMVKLILCTWEFGYFLDICKVRRCISVCICIKRATKVNNSWDWFYILPFFKEFCDLNGISSTAESKDDEGKVIKYIITLKPFNWLCCKEVNVA